LMSRDDFAFMVRVLKKLAADTKFISDDEITEYKRAWRESVALTCMINYYRANVFQMFFNRSEESKQHKFTMPTMFIYGEKDGAVLPETAKNVGSVIDAPFREVRIPNAGHWIQQEATEIVNQSLREFFA
jgi:epoxide hydrolase 4